MRTYTFDGEMIALSSISHIGEARGINSMLRRERIVQPNGDVEEIPVISGNAMRGLLRDRGMLHMLHSLGYGVNEQTGEVVGLSLAAFYFLFSGGALTKEAGKGLDVDEARRWRNAIPLVALFGGAMGNQIMPGKAGVGKALPICKETAHLIPERFVGNDLASIWDMLQKEPYTRKDDEKNEGLRQLISPEVRAQLESGQAEKREKNRQGEDTVSETGQSQQMRYYVETIAAGTRLYWEVSLQDVSDLEFDAFCVTLAEFSRHPYIGGKSGVGHGKVSVKFDNWMEIDPRSAPHGKALDFSLGTRYTQHLQQHGSDIRAIIDGLS